MLWPLPLLKSLHVVKYSPWVWIFLGASRHLPEARPQGPCTSHCWTEKQNLFVSSVLHVTSSHCDASLCCSKNKRLACLIPYWLADPVPNVSFKSWSWNLFEFLILEILNNSVYSWTVNSCSSNWNQQKRHCSCSDVARFTQNVADFIIIIIIIVKLVLGDTTAH